MDSPETTTEENRRLRRTMRDLIALSTLPAIWIGVAPDRIAGSLADVLLNTLSLDFIYVRMAGRSSKDVVEVIRRKSSCENVITETLRAALAPFLSEDRIEPPPSIPNPFGAGSLSTTVTRFGVGDDYGLIVAGSSDAAFPTERDRLLLGVGANQTAIVIQRRRAEELVHEQREWLRVTLASIGDAVIATDTEGRVTFLNEVAEKLTGWTQDEAHSQALEKVFAIRNEQTRQPVENPVGIVLREGVIVGLANHTILVAKDGTERPIDDSAAPIRDSAGKMVGVVLIFRDVTEQRRIEREIRQSEARKRAILETALDCIITMDHEGNVVEFNPAAEQTFGFTREQVVGRELCELIVPLPLRDRHRKGMALYLATGKGPVLNKRIELPAMRADGSEFPAELSITHTSTDERLLFTAYLRDITEKKRSEQQRNLRVAVTQALSEAESTDDGVSGVLRAVCENFNWELGSFWKVDQSADKLVCCASWYMPNAAVAEFESASRGRTFEKAEGLPGRVWDSSKPAWIPDLDHDANFPRLRFATECGLHSAFACPIVVDAQTVGVIEFFTKRFREADAGLLETMGTVSGNIGQFIERNAAVDELRQSERQLADFFENATVGLHWVGPDGIILRANRVELEMLGYSRDEYVGQPRADFHADEEVICDILKRLRAGEKLTEYAARLRCKDGSIKDVLI
ncbi:MAG: chemotaxis protein methyltransferase CheR, partial [Planctomycetaceae bacterium]|nr:chemotaxis protein methyltransferase CheR [Planctomycetaceae bacterium]